MPLGKTQTIELLAPAGSFESLIAAVENGADAVYLGGSAFNARRFAGNFEEQDMRRALAYCHERGVKVHVTFNTLLLDRELKEALHYAAFLYEAGADALIVQDMGLVRMLRFALPDFPLHASTQLGIHDENGLFMCESLGMSRVVLARELSLARIEALHKASAMPLECFAHGALCTAMSGTCLFSSLAGGRSGNRGECAQPCRKAYRAEGGQLQHPLSLQDLCMLTHIDELRAAGVMSIKLEGRMKRAEYVAAMVRAYRLAIDGAPKNELYAMLDTMQRIFDRGDSTGYYYNRDLPCNARGVLRSDASCLRDMRDTYQGIKRTQPITAVLRLEVSTPARLKLSAFGVSVEVTGEIVQAAQKTPDVSRYIAQLEKLGGTPFKLAHCDILMEQPAYLSVAAQNALRRAATNALSLALVSSRTPITPNMPAPLQKQKEDTKLLAIVPDALCAQIAFEAGAHFVALAPRDYSDAKEALLRLQGFRKNAKLLLHLCAADFDGSLMPVWQTLFESDLLDGGIAEHVSQARVIRGMKIGGYLLNATNAQAVSQYIALGFDCILSSLELNKAQLRDLTREMHTGVYAYGYAQMMQLWHCPQKTLSGRFACKTCSLPLIDEAGRSFALDPVKAGEGCLTRVRNCEAHDILDLVYLLGESACVALEFTSQTPEEVRERVQAARRALLGKSPVQTGATRGHWNRGLEPFV